MGRRVAFRVFRAGAAEHCAPGVAALVPSSQKQGFKPKDPNSEAPKPKSEHKIGFFVLGQRGIGAPGREIIGIGKRNRRDVYPSCKSPRTLPKYKYLITR